MGAGMIDVHKLEQEIAKFSHQAKRLSVCVTRAKSKPPEAPKMSQAPRVRLVSVTDS